MNLTRTIKVLSNLILLAVFCTGQVAAAPSNLVNVTDESLSLSASSISPVIEDSSPPIELAQQAEPISPGETIRISGEAGGDNPSISMDGRFVAFESAGEVYVQDILSGPVSNILIGSGSKPYISATGRYTVYLQGTDIYVWDMEEETNTLVATGSSPTISADGRYVAFESSDDVFVRDLLLSFD